MTDAHTTSYGTPLDRESYVNLETFRKDGTGVKTPVWAAPLDGKLVIVTDGRSYKVKRLRNNPACRIAACDVRGNVRGSFYEATARILEDPDLITRAHAALRKKYGLQFVALDFFAGISGRKSGRAYLEVTVKP